MFHRRLIAVALVLCCIPVIGAASNNKLSLMQRIERLESIVEGRGFGQGQTGQGSAATADIMSRLDELRLELSRLRGAVELQGHRIDQLSSAQRDMYRDIDRRLTQGGSGDQVPAVGRAPQAAAPSDELAAPAYEPPDSAYQPSGSGYQESDSGYQGSDSGYQAPVSGYQTPTPARQAGAPFREMSPTAPGLASVPALPAPERASYAAAPPTASPVVPGNPAQEDARYTAAFDLLKAGRYDESAKAFRAFVADYPNGRYADNAQYWLGETAYVQRDFKTALAEFGKVTRGYPASPKVPDALLKTGFIYCETAQWADARRELNQVVQSYPTSTAARLARQRLQQLDQEHH